MFGAFATIAAALALYFNAVPAIRQNLQGVTGRRFRRLITRFTDQPALTAAWGFVFGAFMESPSAVAGVMASLLTANQITMRRAQVIAAWSNLGLVVLVVLALIDFHSAILMMIGVAGIFAALNPGSRYRTFAHTVYQWGLVLLGLKMMKEGIEAIAASPAFPAWGAVIHDSLLGAFVFGLLVRIPVQSSSAVTVLAIILHQADIFTTEQVLLMMGGIGIGSGFAIILLTRHTKGETRQISLFQALVNMIGSLLFMALCLAERLVHPTGLEGAFRSLAHDPAHAFTYAYFIQLAFCPVAAVLLWNFAPRLLERLAPVTVEEDLAKPRYLQDDLGLDVPTVLDNVEREQTRLFGYLPRLLAGIGADTPTEAPVPPDRLHASFNAVAREVQETLTDLTRKSMVEGDSIRLLYLENRQALLWAVEDDLLKLVQGVTARSIPVSIASTAQALIEGLTTQMLATLDSLESRDLGDIELLLKITGDRSALMESMRQAVLERGGELSYEDRSFLFWLTSHFERQVAMLRQFGVALAKAAAQAQAADAPAPAAAGG